MEENIFSVEGRISRSVFWTRWLIVFCCNIVLIIVQLSMQDKTVAVLVAIISLILSVFMFIQSIKRMHDVDKSGWYSIVPVYNIILALTDGTPGPNRYGPDPKARTVVCPSCSASNDPNAGMCNICGEALPVWSPSTISTIRSDTFLLIFVTYSVVETLATFLIQTLVPDWYEGFLRVIFGGLNILWGGALLLVGLAIRNERYRVVGIVLTSIWGLYVIISNISFMMT